MLAEETCVVRCIWCLKESADLTQDHVVPRSIGGTLQYAVPACKTCQEILSKPERELSRRSILAIHALSSQIRQRHPERPTSGLLQASCFLVKHPLGGFGESVLRSGEKLESLAHVEIKVVPGEPVEGRVRGATWEESERIFSSFKSALTGTPGPDGLVCEIDTSLEVPPPVAEDLDFWPRMVLLPDGRLMIRARNADEAQRFAAVMTQLVLNPPARSKHTWTSAMITGGTVHHLELKYEPQLVRRVIAKIAYGLFRCTTGIEFREEDDIRLRSYILGWQEPDIEPVMEAPEKHQFTTSAGPHRFVLAPAHDREAAIIDLYGHPYRVQLGSAGILLPEPIIVFCATDGTGMRIANSEERTSVLCEFQSLTWTSVPPAVD
jgi:hypothetical protein